MDDFLTALGAICFCISVYAALAYQPNGTDIRASTPRRPFPWMGSDAAAPASSGFASAACHPRRQRRDSRRRSLCCEMTSPDRVRSSRR